MCCGDITQIVVRRLNCGREWPKQVLEDHLGADAMVSGDRPGLKLRREKTSRRRSGEWCPM